jgi:hypothetical protein
VQCGLAVEPAGLRDEGVRHNAPRTPEPSAGPDHDAQLPSPPRPRLRLKRRNLPTLSGPTQHFLASVAAADVPIPSIEEPEIASLDSDMVDHFTDMNQFDEGDPNLLNLRGRRMTPPKTPAPGIAPSLPDSTFPAFPLWNADSTFVSSAESSPERDLSSSRPSTSRSTGTSFSLLSGLSQSSDDCHNLSPDADPSDKFVLDRWSEGIDNAATIRPSRKGRKAPWTKAMSSHLWSTYNLYLQDPKVTPFRPGKSGIPPHGVCSRVARQAKRSWKGAKALGKASGGPRRTKSGSNTPTGESSGAFIEWPHTAAATRAHLRDLCKIHASTPGGSRSRHCVSQSPTPFTEAASRHWNRRSTPLRSPSVFGYQDMAMSLALSTSDAMQPEGPLAQLTNSSSEPTTAESSFRSDLPENPPVQGDSGASFAERQRLGSPFTARSYGPSSSSSLAAMLGLTGTRQQAQTIGPRRSLQSPVRLSRSATQKRRSKQTLGLRRRPTLASDVFTDPTLAAALSSRAPEFSSTNTKQHDDLFVPRIAVAPVVASSTAPELPTPRLENPLAPPPRLGSPFSSSSTSFSFPNRLSQPTNLDMVGLGRPFATVQRPADEPTAIPARTNLASRLAYIDRRLKEFNNRANGAPRRSESPFS